jgi:hypothetical protein
MRSRSPRPYDHADAVLPADLLLDLQRACGGQWADITFLAGGPLGVRERRLSHDLVLRVRAALRTVVSGARRIYVPANTSLRPAVTSDGRADPASLAPIARQLVAAGHGKPAIADVLNMSLTTLYRLTAGVPGRPPGRPTTSSSAMPPHVRQPILRRGLICIATRINLQRTLPDDNGAAVTLLADLLYCSPAQLEARALSAGRVHLALQSQAAA